jgi:hypothetical protein
VWLVWLVWPRAGLPHGAGRERLSPLFTQNVPAKRDKTVAGTHVEREMWGATMVKSPVTVVNVSDDSDVVVRAGAGAGLA